MDNPENKPEIVVIEKEKEEKKEVEE